MTVDFKNKENQKSPTINESENHNIPIVNGSVTNKLQCTTVINESSKIASPLAEKQYGQYFYMALDFENKENQKSPTIDETTGTEDEIGPTFTNNDVTISRERERDSSSSSSSISTSSSSIPVFDNTSASNSCSSSSDDFSKQTTTSIST
uniref:Cell wall integrity and stress response component 1-like n=1 Tax=Diabrotica virgifera virgifera TaxID=50390 RepID=A0A6P7GK60_DIAVI